MNTLTNKLLAPADAPQMKCKRLQTYPVTHPTA
jgi:hypothetical protein